LYEDKSGKARKKRPLSQLTAEERQAYDQAVASWVQAAGENARRQPDNYVAWTDLSRAAVYAGMPDLANRTFWHARDLADKEKKAFTMLVYEQGVHLFGPMWCDDPKSLEEVIDLIARKRSDDAFLLAGAISYDPDHETAKSVYQRVADVAREDLKENEGDAAAHTRLGRALGYLDQNDEAAVHFTRAAALKPGDDQFQIEYADVLYKNKDYKAAAEHFRATLRIKPGRLYARTQLAWCMNEMGQLAEAEALAKETLRDYPDDSDAHNVLGAIYVKQDKTGAAIAEYRASLETQPNQPQIKKYVDNLAGPKKQSKWWPW
jgi:tetratricopeptide (TPR) repeat protein